MFEYGAFLILINRLFSLLSICASLVYKNYGVAILLNQSFTIDFFCLLFIKLNLYHEYSHDAGAGESREVFRLASLSYPATNLSSRIPDMSRLYAITGVVGLSFAAVFVKLISLSPGSITFWRTAYAIPMLLGVRFVLNEDDPRPAELRLQAVLAGAIFSADLTLFHHAIELIGAGLSTVLANTQVVFVGIAAWILYGERPKTVAVVAVPIVFVGVVLISGLGAEQAYGSYPVLGVFTGLGAALAYSGFLLLFRSAGKERTHTSGPLLDATFGAVLVAFLYGVFLESNFSLMFVWPSHGWLIALALVVQVSGWLLVAVALPRLPALETSIILLLQPSLTVLWGLVFFSEYLSLYQWIGVGLVLGGIGVLSSTGAVKSDSNGTEEE